MCARTKMTENVNVVPIGSAVPYVKAPLKYIDQSKCIKTIHFAISGLKASNTFPTIDVKNWASTVKPIIIPTERKISEKNNVMKIVKTGLTSDNTVSRHWMLSPASEKANEAAYVMTAMKMNCPSMTKIENNSFEK